MSIPLNKLETDLVGTIKSIHAGQELHRRLSGLGIRTGIRIKIIRRSPFNGPMQIRVGHTDLMLRPADAAHIEVCLSS
jgi:ferrous iron transport protein A